MPFILLRKNQNSILFHIKTQEKPPIKIIYMYIQLDLFEENDELSILKKQIKAIDDRTRNVQRGLFARHAELVKMYLKQHEEIETIRAMMLKKVK